MRWISIMAMLLALWPQRSAADLPDDCTQSDDWWLRVRACTEAIGSVRWPGAAASWAYSNRAVAHAELGDYISAFDDHEKAVALNPADAVAWNNKGNTHAAFREYDRALSAFGHAIALNPGYASALYNRAGVHLAVSDPASSANDYSAVIAAEPDFGEAWAGRAEARCMLGDAAGSVADRLTAIRLGALGTDDVAGYLRETGYLSSQAASEKLEPALAAWTAAGCP